MRTQVKLQASLSGLRIRCCPELRCRLQTWLRSQVAVAVVQAWATALTQLLAWELSYAKCKALKKQEEKKKKKDEREYI